MARVSISFKSYNRTQENDNLNLIYTNNNSIKLIYTNNELNLIF